MKKLGICSLVLALAMIFTLPVSVSASDVDTLPEAGMTPDSPFYFMERWGEQISLAFTFNAEAKVEKALRYAEERLAEAEAVAAQNKVRAMERAYKEYCNCLEVATRNMERAMNKGVNTSEQVTAAMSKHISYMYQHQYNNQQSDTACEDCQQIRQQVRERAMTCQEDAVETLASQDPEEALELNLRLTEQACNRLQNMVGQNNSEQIEEALRQCERFRAMSQEMVENAEDLGLSLEVQQMAQQQTATQDGFMNQIRNQFRLDSGNTTDSQIQNGGQQQGGTTTESTAQSESGPMGPAPNSGDGISDGSGFDSPNGPNGNP
jgi:hypothetical protein